MNKLFLGLVLALIAAGLAFAAVPNYDLTGTWALDFNLGGSDYLHTMQVTAFNPTTGAFSGTGTYNPDNSYTWTVTGTVSGNSVSYHILYTGTNAGYTVDAIGTFSSNTLMGGTWSSSIGQAGTWTGAGNAAPVDNDKGRHDKDGKGDDKDKKGHDDRGKGDDKDRKGHGNDDNNKRD